MIRRIRTRIQRFWDIMTNKEWKQAILNADKDDTVPYEFITMIDKSEIKEILEQRIKGQKQWLADKGIDETEIYSDLFYNGKIALKLGLDKTVAIVNLIQSSEDRWLAEQLNIDLEDNDLGKGGKS